MLLDKSFLTSYCLEATGDNVLRFTKIRRLKDLPNIITSVTQTLSDLPCVIFDFRGCGNPHAIGLKYEGNYHRIGDNAIAVFNKAFKVMRPAASSHVLFINDQRYAIDGSSLISSGYEIKITPEVVNVTKSNYYEEPLAHLETIVGYLVDSAGKVEMVWEPMTKATLAPNEEQVTGRTSAEKLANPAKFFGATPRKPFFQRMIETAVKTTAPEIKCIPAPEIAGSSADSPVLNPVENPVYSVVGEVSSDEEAAKLLVTNEVSLPIKSCSPVDYPKTAEIVKAMGEPNPIEQPKSIEVPKPAEQPKPVEQPKPSEPMASFVPFTPIAPRKVCNYFNVTWGGLLMTKFTEQATAADLEKNINSDILYFTEGVDKKIFSRLVFGGGYCFVNGDAKTNFPGSILFKQSIVTQLSTGSSAVKARMNDASPCNIPTLFRGSTLVK